MCMRIGFQSLKTKQKIVSRTPSFILKNRNEYQMKIMNTMNTIRKKFNIGKLILVYKLYK